MFSQGLQVKNCCLLSNIFIGINKWELLRKNIVEVYDRAEIVPFSITYLNNEMQKLNYTSNRKIFCRMTPKHAMGAKPEKNINNFSRSRIKRPHPDDRVRLVDCCYVPLGL